MFNIFLGHVNDIKSKKEEKLDDEKEKKNFFFSSLQRRKRGERDKPFISLTRCIIRYLFITRLFVSYSNVKRDRDIDRERYSENRVRGEGKTSHYHSQNVVIIPLHNAHLLFIHSEPYNDSSGGLRQMKFRCNYVDTVGNKDKRSLPAHI